MHESAQSSPVLTPFGKYLLDEEIARGGMARVYLARLRGLGGFEKKLVVKQVRPELARDPRFVEMFVEEAKTLVQMSHPHIVPVYELGVVDGVYFLAMEHVDGATLAEILREDGALAPPLAAHVGVQVCDALEYAHAGFDLVHRDVTPRNVIVDGLGHVRLLDFGIAAKADGMIAGEVFGSHGYMSPEQARGEPLTPRSDLFALGVVLYEALTGEPAFLRGTAEETQRALDEESPTLRGRAEIPGALVALLEELLQRDPGDRPDSAARVGKRLRGWLAGARPEGVAPELAARTGSAREHRHRIPSSPQPAADRSDPSRVVRSIATSVTLQKLLDSEPSRLSDPDLGTVPLARPAPATHPSGVDPPEKAQPRDVDSATAPETSTSDATQRMPERRQPRADGSSRAENRPRVVGRWRRVVTAVGAGLVVGVALMVWAGGSDPGSVTSPAEPHVAEERPVSVDREPTTEAGPVEAPAEAAPEPPARTPPPIEPPPAPAAPTRSATVTINSTPWSEVTLDGRPVGNTPLRALRVTPGPHVLVLESPPLGRSARVPIRATAGARTRVIVDLNSEPPRITLR